MDQIKSKVKNLAIPIFFLLYSQGLSQKNFLLIIKLIIFRNGVTKFVKSKQMLGPDNNQSLIKRGTKFWIIEKNCADTKKIPSAVSYKLTCEAEYPDIFKLIFLYYYQTKYLGQEKEHWMLNITKKIKLEPLPRFFFPLISQ